MLNLLFSSINVASSSFFIFGVSTFINSLILAAIVSLIFVFLFVSMSSIIFSMSKIFLCTCLYLSISSKSIFISSSMTSSSSSTSDTFFRICCDFFNSSACSSLFPWHLLKGTATIVLRDGSLG